MKIKTGSAITTFFRELDRTVAILGLIISIILTIYTIQEVGRIVYVIPAILLFCSCLVWLLIRKRFQTELQIELPESRPQFVFCLICFLILFSLSILSIYFRSNLYERPLSYFIFLSLIAVVMTYEIFVSSRKYVGIILLQIILMGVNIAWSQLLIFPMLIGVDPWYHATLTNQIIQTSALTTGFAYSLLPFFHLYISATSIILEVPYKFAAMLSVSLGQIICNSLFVYLISEKLLKNYRIGLLAALFVMMANYSIQMSYWSIPNAFAGVFIPIVLYLFFINKDQKNNFTYNCIAVLFLIAIIFTHTITAMCMLILLLIIWGIPKIYNYISLQTKSFITAGIVICFAIGMFAWWSYASGSTLTIGNTLLWSINTDFFDKSSEYYTGYLAVQPVGEQIFNQLGMFLFFGVSIIGFFYMISRKNDVSAFTLAWGGIVLLIISMFSLIGMNVGIQGRWWYFAQILLCIPLAVTIYLSISSKLIITKIKYWFVLGFVFSLCFLMIMSPIANIDNHILSPKTADRAVLTQSELSSVTLLQSYGGTIRADWYFTYVISHLSPKTLNTPFYSEIETQNYKKLRGNLLLIRQYILNHPFMSESDVYNFDYNPITKIDQSGFSEIYNSGGAYGYL